MVEVPAVVVAQVQQTHQAAPAAMPAALETTLIRTPAVQAHLLVRALEVPDLVLPAMVALAEVGEQLVLQAVRGLRQAALQVSRYKDGLMLLDLPATQVLAVLQQQVKN
jgi:hypothetical protein